MLINIVKISEYMFNNPFLYIFANIYIKNQHKRAVNDLIARFYVCEKLL